MDLFNLVARITLDSSEYQKQLGNAEEKTNSFGSKVKSGIGTAAKVGGAALAAVGTTTVALTKTMIDGAADTAAYGDHIDKMSQKMGISAEAYQEWDAIMQHSGTTIDALKPSMKTLAAQAEKGSDAFQKLGISQEEVRNLSQEDLFAKVISGLQGMEEGSERTYLTSQLLGRGATELGALLNTSAEDTEKMRQKVHELGGVMSNDAVKSAAAYQDSLQDMQTAFSGLKRNLFGEFMPSLTTVMDGISELFTTGGTDKIVEGISSFVSKISEAIPKIIDKGGQIVSSLAESILSSNNLQMLMNSGLTLITTLTTTIIDSAPQLINTVMEMIQQIISGDALPNLLKKIGDALPVLIPQLVTAVVSLVVFLMEHYGEFIQPIADALPYIIESIVVALFSNLPQLIEGCISMVGSIISAVVQVLGTLLSLIFDPIIKWVGEVKAKVWTAITNFFSDIWDAVSGAFGKAATWVYDTIIKPVADYFKKLWDKLVSTFHMVIDPWIEIVKRASKLVYDKIIKPVLDYFKKLWDDITAIWKIVSGWFDENVIEPVRKLFKGIWDSVKEGAHNAWEGIKNAFSPVVNWFHDVFSKAWQKVKDVFSTGGKVFDGIKEGIENTFKTVVNAIIGGINKIIAVPFNAINDILEKIHDIEILGVSPFDWVHTFEIPEMPLLAKGGIVNRPVIAGEDGAEAIIPLERNTEWIDKVARQLESSSNSENVKLMRMMLEEMQAVRRDMYEVILAALRTNSNDFDGSERDMIRLVKKYAFA